LRHNVLEFGLERIELHNSAVWIKNGLIDFYNEGGFPTEIMNFGPVYWVSSFEYQPDKYFKSEKDAISFAQSNYEVSIGENDEEDDSEVPEDDDLSEEEEDDKE
jgi:hypothetical protein